MQHGNSLDIVLKTLKSKDIFKKKISNIIYISDLKNNLRNFYEPCINIFIGNPDILIPSFLKLFRYRINNHFNIGYWYWELDKLPFKWKLTSGIIDQVWVNTEFTAKAFKEINKEVIKIPFILSVDYLKKLKINKLRKFKHFTFIFVFDFLSSYDRKNPAAIIKAFKLAFPSNLELRLILKSINGNIFAHNKNSLTQLIGSDKRIRLIDKKISHLGILQLIKKSHCYISLHRSEGLGLGLLEAMLLKVPVIATNYSGNLEFMNENNSYLVDCNVIKVNHASYIYSKNSRWADPSINCAQNCMKMVYHDYGEAKNKANIAYNFVKGHYSHENFRKIINKI